MAPVEREREREREREGNRSDKLHAYKIHELINEMGPLNNITGKIYIFRNLVCTKFVRSLVVFIYTFKQIG